MLLLSCEAQSVQTRPRQLELTLLMLACFLTLISFRKRLSGNTVCSSQTPAGGCDDVTWTPGWTPAGSLMRYV